MKLLRIKILRTFLILGLYKLFPYAGIKKYRDKEISEYIINPF